METTNPSTTIPNTTFSNSSNVTHPHVASHKNWLRHIFLTDVTLAIVLYITVRLSMDVHQARKSTVKELSGKRYRYLMKVTTLLLSISVALHLADGIFEEVIVDYYLPDMCGFSKCVKAITGSLAFMFSYLVMWLRQRSIYSDAAIRHLTTPIFRALSFVVVFLLVASPVTNTIIYIASFSFEVVATGCAIVGSSINPETPWIIIGVTSAVMQIILLGLFLQPLLRHQFNMNGMPAGNFNLKPLIMRAFITALICTITDTGTAILAASSVFNDGVTIGVAMQISTLLNLLMVILSFPDWKKTVFPRCCCRSEYSTPEESVPPTSASESASATHCTNSI
ncbi:uncharacterized protein LOC120337731 isoform X2 [Styela clava]